MLKVISEEIVKANGHTTAVLSWISAADSLHAKFSAMSMNAATSIGRKR